jgi:chromosome segregation ATPase/CheY-like chemotaxis protein
MGQRLLIVDGDRRFIKDHQIALEAAFDVDFLYSADGVLPLLESGDFAAVLVCVEVSENKGYAVCSAIRKNPQISNLKVAIISSKATEEEYARHRSLKGRADLYLHKPLISSALIASLTPLVPPRSVDPDNPLGDLSGTDLGDEWLESLKAELDTDDRPALPPPPPSRGATRETYSRTHAIPPLSPVSIALPPISPDAGKVELLESRVKDLEGKLALKDQELQELRWKHDSATRNIDDLEQRQKEADLLQQKLMASETRIQALASETAGKDESIAGLHRSIEEAESDHQRLMTLVEDLERQLSDKEGERAALLESSREFEGRLAALPELQDRNRELEAEIERLREAERSAAGLQSRLDETERSAEELRGHVDEQGSRISELQYRLEAQTDLEPQLAEARENLERQEARVQEMQAQRDAKAQELVEKDREVESLKVDVAGFEATLRGQRRELAEQGGRLGSLTRECEVLQAQLARQDERIQELARLLSEKMQILAERDFEISEVKKAAQEQEKALAERSQILEDREKDVLQLRNTKDQLELHCEDMERDMARIVTQHECQQLELMKGVDEREAQIGQLNAAMEGLREQLACLAREKQALEGNLSERSARLDALTGAISDLEAGIRRASDLTRPF